MDKPAARYREKVSATLAPELLRQVEAHQRKAGLPSFSAALEDLLWRSLQEEKERAYYLSLTEEEWAEQESWTRLATEQAFKSLREG